MCRSSANAKGDGGFRKAPSRASAELGKAKAHHVEVPDSEEYEIYTLKPLGGIRWVVTPLINGTQMEMEIDTGSAVSITSKKVWMSLLKGRPLKATSAVLKTVTGEKVPVLGELEVSVQPNGQDLVLSLLVMDGNGPMLMGRNWLSRIKLDWPRVCHMAQPQSVSQLLSQYNDLFQPGIGTLRNYEAKLDVDPDATPKFFKPRAVPYSLRPISRQELDKLVSMGILEQVMTSEWASPIVQVPKADGSIRICSDYKVTINPVLKVEQFPLPKPEDLFSTLVGGQKFSKLGLANAYQQLKVDPSSRKYLTISTHKGLYQYTRLPFGVASAPAISQHVMERILDGIPGVCCYLDDILVTGESDQDLLQNLQAVSQRLNQLGLRLKETKCNFMQDSVQYL